jgi:hypothetical protein
MNISKLLLAGVVGIAAITGIVAFKAPEKQVTKEVMMINVLESVVQGGMGRSRMIVTLPNGKQESTNLENYYSLVGVNFGNIEGNDAKVIKTLNDLAKEGWKVVSASSGGNSLYFTKYTLVREQ